jgi:hypothetical protein
MTDKEVETLIWRTLQKNGITFNDMIGVSNYVEDTDSITLEELGNTRCNRFKEYSGAGRMKEILRRGKNNHYNDYPPLKVSLQDLFAFWWHRCIDRETFIEEVLEDIYDYFTEGMRPPQEIPETTDTSLDFEDALAPQITDLNEERIKRKGYG